MPRPHAETPFDGLLRGGGAGRVRDLADPLPMYACDAAGGRIVRDPVMLLGPVISRQVFAQLRTTDLARLLLPATRNGPLELILDHIVVPPPQDEQLLNLRGGCSLA
ncbi:hypothetical protein ACIBG7_11515 [Nonomuraea sp. NPDC050328]|uniref:hypothetical protein n=1 Tax=Nonomuraea sp. NPDC050328 TaxID=3364361 RepID=UPI0037AA023D